MLFSEGILYFKHMFLIQTVLLRIKIKLFFISAFIIVGCSIFKNQNGKLVYRNIDFNFDNCCLATQITGTGKINVHENMLEVTIIDGSIKLNPEFSNKTYTVGNISLSLGRLNKKYKWEPFNKGGNIISLNETISSISDSIDLSGYVFRIPYYNKTDLLDSWIVITTTNEDRRGFNYAHSIGKNQSFIK